jgi:molybdate transport system substrate-binding protein
MDKRTIVALAACAALLGAAPPVPVPHVSVQGADEALDLHGNPCTAQLVVLAAGNQWMAMPDLLAAFQREHSGVTRIFYETLPPGILARQLRAGSVAVGNLRIDVRADVFLAGKRRMDDVVGNGLVAKPIVYATNVLAIAVRKADSKGVRSLLDLGRPDVRVAMPNPEFEGVARQIETAYRKAGGERLVQTIMVTKVRNGTTLLTQIHHRQTPMWLISGHADAGPVWLTEALYQQRIGAPIETVRIPPSQNVRATYEAASTLQSSHRQLAREFVRFLASPQAQGILHSYGFGAPTLSEEGSS